MTALGALLAVCAGCAPTASVPAQTPSPSDTSATGSASAEVPSESPYQALPPAPAAVPPPGAECAPFGAGATAESERSTCSSAKEALAAALSLTDALARDRALSALESCDDWPRGFVRALRAEVAPTPCGDVVIADELSNPSAVDDELREPLIALTLAGRLRRMAAEPPPPPEEHTKEALQEYFQGAMFPWISKQAEAIHAMASTGASLRGYAKGIVAVEAGMADMRFVELVRAVPIPTEMAEDRELRDVYYASLDEALEPRKRRGRDAALVGLRELAKVGLLEDERIRSARDLLSRVYGGRRVNALDSLLVPELEPPHLTTSEDRLAATLPTFYVPWASLTVPSDDAALGGRLRAYLERGLPAAVRLDLGSKAISENLALLLSRGYFELGRTYFRSEDFAKAKSLLEGREGPEARELSALSTALMAGPRDAAQLILEGPRFADALGNLEALDTIARGNDARAGRAAFNAAYLRELVAPEGDPAYWRQLQKRYLRAAQLLSGGERAEARTRATAAGQTAQAITPDS